MALQFQFYSRARARKSGEQAQEQNSNNGLEKFDSTQAKEITGQDKFIKTLALNLKAGESFSYKYSHKIINRNDTVEMTDERIQFYTKKIKAIRSDGSIELSLKFDTLIFNQKFQTPHTIQNRSFNSNVEADRKNKEFEQNLALLNEEFTLIIDNKGMILEVTGLIPLVNKILGTAKDSASPQQKSQIAERLRYEIFEPISDENLKFPNKELDSSQSWAFHQKTLISPVVIADVTTNYKINSVKSFNNKKVVESLYNFQGDLTLDPKVKGKQSFTKKEYSGFGSTLLNVENGMTIKKRNDIRLVMEGSVGAQKVNQEMNTFYSFELIK